MTRRPGDGGIAALVFDFDGTLVDSAAIKKNSFISALGAGRTVDREKCELAYATHGTINRTELLALSFTDIYSRAPSPAERAALADAYTAYFRDHMGDVKLFPSLPEFYEKFGQQYQFMISSNAPQGEIVELCTKLGIDKYFTAVYGHPVGKAAALRDIVAGLDVQPANLLYIGDRVEDGMVADSVGTRFCRLDPGFHSTSSSDGIVRSLAGLADVITSPGFDTGGNA